ncbi:MAG: acyl carrier protein [Candidatus Stygibacter frigidus]|nr:acyl carrier protein [Candidatus Stygibacter frigidus]
MKKAEFLVNLASVLELDDVILTFDSNLNDLDDYDSFSILSIIAFIHKNFNLQLAARQLNKINTPQDLIQLIGIDKFE